MRAKKLIDVMNGKTFFICICLLVIGILPLRGQAATVRIIWNPERVEQAIDPGQTENFSATFTSSISLENVDVWVNPELQPFVSVQPNHFDIIEPNTPYAVTLDFFIPQSTQAGVYEGTIHARVGSKTFPQTLKVMVNVADSLPTPPQGPWLSFVEGNPGIPGDGVFINPIGGAILGFLELTTPIPLGQFTDGFTATFFTEPNVNSQTLGLQLNIGPSKPCSIGFTGYYDGTVLYNGILGYFGNISKSDLQLLVVDHINTYYPQPQCNATLNNLFLYYIVISDVSACPSACFPLLDAFSILPIFHYTDTPGPVYESEDSSTSLMLARTLICSVTTNRGIDPVFQKEA